MVASKVECPNCGRHIPAADINITALMGKCANCDHVFSLDKPGTAAANSESVPSRPSGIVHESGYSDELILRRSWFHPALFGLLFFCIAWDAFLIFWYSIAFFGGANADGFGWIMIIFPIGHVAVGVGLTYYVLAGFLNRTTVVLDFEKLSITHGPIPWRGNRCLMREEILELELEFGNIQSSPASGLTLPMTVSAHHQDGRQIVLLSAIPQRHAEYIAWHLADALKVKLVRKDEPLMSGQAVPRLIRRFLGQ